MINGSIDDITNYVKLLDRISNVLGLPNIRRYKRSIPLTEYERNTCNHLSDLGFSLEREYTLTTYDYLYISNPGRNIVSITISMTSKNVELYKDILEKIDSIPTSDLLSMDNEELELILRLN